MKQDLKATKSCGYFQKGDILKWNDEACAYILDVREPNSHRQAIIGSDTTNRLKQAGYLISIDNKIDKISYVTKYIDKLLNDYETTQKDTITKYNNKEIPECVKVEATTVHYNLIKVLNKIKKLLNE